MNAFLDRTVKAFASKTFSLDECDGRLLHFRTLDGRRYDVFAIEGERVISYDYHVGATQWKRGSWDSTWLPVKESQKTQLIVDGLIRVNFTRINGNIRVDLSRVELRGKKKVQAVDAKINCILNTLKFKGE